MEKYLYKYRDVLAVTVRDGEEYVSPLHAPNWTAPIYNPYGDSDGAECWIYTNTMIPGLDLIGEDVEVGM